MNYDDDDYSANNSTKIVTELVGLIELGTAVIACQLVLFAICIAILIATLT